MLLLLFVERHTSYSTDRPENTIPAPEPESPYPTSTLVIPAKAGTPTNRSHGGLDPPPTPLYEHGFSSRKDAKTQSPKYKPFVLEDIFRVSASLREYFLSLEENTKQKM